MPRAERLLRWSLAHPLCLQDAVSSSAPPEKGKDEKSKPKENPEESKKWAIPVNITAPCDDFYKRVPNPAFKVGVLKTQCHLFICRNCVNHHFVMNDPVSSSAPVAIWAGCLPEAGCAPAGGSRLRVCSRSHIGWQNSGGRIRHRSLPETHDEVCMCWDKSISPAPSLFVVVQRAKHTHSRG